MTKRTKQEGYPEQVPDILLLIKALWGEPLPAVYLYGSCTLGGLRPNSDIDLLVISSGEMPENLRAALTEALLRVSGRPGCGEKRPIELTVVRSADLLPLSSPPRCMYLYGEWLREGIEAGAIPQPYFEPDLTVLLWQARMHSHPLCGPPAAELIPEIPFSEVKKAMQDSLPGLLSGIRGDERNVLLTLARMLYTQETGTICSKDAAGRWALPLLPEELRPLMETAVKGYLGLCRDNWQGLERETGLLAAFLKEKIEKI